MMKRVAQLIALVGLATLVAVPVAEARVKGKTTQAKKAAAPGTKGAKANASKNRVPRKAKAGEAKAGAKAMQRGSKTRKVSKAEGQASKGMWNGRPAPRPKARGDRRPSQGRPAVKITSDALRGDAYHGDAYWSDKAMGDNMKVKR